VVTVEENAKFLTINQRLIVWLIINLRSSSRTVERTSRKELLAFQTVHTNEHVTNSYESVTERSRFGGIKWTRQLSGRFRCSTKNIRTRTKFTTHTKCPVKLLSNCQNRGTRWRSKSSSKV